MVTGQSIFSACPVALSGSPVSLLLCIYHAKLSSALSLSRVRAPKTSQQLAGAALPSLSGSFNNYSQLLTIFAYSLIIPDHPVVRCCSTDILSTVFSAPLSPSSPRSRTTTCNRTRSLNSKPRAWRINVGQKRDFWDRGERFDPTAGSIEAL